MHADPKRAFLPGTDLLIQFRAGVRQPPAFNDIKYIFELMAIGESDSGVRIGASVAVHLRASRPQPVLALPRPVARTSDADLRLIPRSEMDLAIAGAAVSVTLGGSGICTAARVAVGAIAPTALLVPAASAALVGSDLDDDALGRAAEAARILP